MNFGFFLHFLFCCVRQLTYKNSLKTSKCATSPNVQNQKGGPSRYRKSKRKTKKREKIPTPSPIERKTAEKLQKRTLDVVRDKLLKKNVPLKEFPQQNAEKPRSRLATFVPVIPKTKHENRSISIHGSVYSYFMLPVQTFRGMMAFDIVSLWFRSYSANSMYFSWTPVLDLGSMYEVAGTLGNVFSCLWDVSGHWVCRHVAWEL